MLNVNQVHDSNGFKHEPTSNKRKKKQQSKFPGLEIEKEFKPNHFRPIYEIPIDISYLGSN